MMLSRVALACCAAVEVFSSVLRFAFAGEAALCASKDDLEDEMTDQRSDWDRGTDRARNVKKTEEQPFFLRLFCPA